MQVFIGREAGIVVGDVDIARKIAAQSNKHNNIASLFGGRVSTCNYGWGLRSPAWTAANAEQRTAVTQSSVYARGGWLVPLRAPNSVL